MTPEGILEFCESNAHEAHLNMSGLRGVDSTDATLTKRKPLCGVHVMADDQTTLFDWAEQEAVALKSNCVYLSHKIELKPNWVQANYFARACGTARFAWNWALAEWNRHYQAGEKPNANALCRQLNETKHKDFPWMAEVSKLAPERAILHLGEAFSLFFAGKARRPKFKKKGVHDSFHAGTGKVDIRCNGQYIRLPIIGWVRMTQELRFDGKLVRATVSRTADRWFVSILVEIPWSVPARENQASAGIDLGIKAMATCSDGTVYSNPMPLKKAMKRLKRLSRRMHRKQKGSQNRFKAKKRLARLYYRIACVRNDALHKATTDIIRKFSTVVIEDLNVKGMTANHRIARAINDVGMYEFRRQLTYKAALYGTEVIVVDRFFPSSKLCSDCGHPMETMPLNVRGWTCPKCGAVHDRDLNAARNLLNQSTGRYPGIHASGDGSSAVLPLNTVKPVVERGITAHG